MEASSNRNSIMSYMITYNPALGMPLLSCSSYQCTWITYIISSYNGAALWDPIGISFPFIFSLTLKKSILVLEEGFNMICQYPESVSNDILCVEFSICITASLYHLIRNLNSIMMEFRALYKINRLHINYQHVKIYLFVC